MKSPLIDAVAAAEAAYYRLVLLVGPPGAGKTRALELASAEEGWPILRVSGLLAGALLDYPQRRRAVVVPGLVAGLLSQESSPVVCLDNIELLFEPSLAQDPLRLLQNLARDRTIVAVWPGRYDDGVLTYAADDHPEAHRYSRPEATVIPVPSRV